MEQIDGHDVLFTIVTDGCGTVAAMDSEGNRVAEAELPEMDSDQLTHWHRACRQVVSELAAKAWVALDLEI